MSSLNLSLVLKSYNGNNSNACTNLNFSKVVGVNSISVDEYKTETVTLSASESLVLFDVLTAEARKLVYIEASGECDIEVNGVAEIAIEPIIVGTSVKNGVYLKSGVFEKVELTNNGTDDIIISYVAVK